MLAMLPPKDRTRLIDLIGQARGQIVAIDTNIRPAI